jgi:hypothetical protein
VFFAGDLDSLSEFAPSFLWLLRDFYLKLEEDGKKVSPQGLTQLFKLAIQCVLIFCTLTSRTRKGLGMSHAFASCLLRLCGHAD